MIKGMTVAINAVGSAMFLLVMLVYIFAIIMHSFLKDEATLKDFFVDIPTCMLTLLSYGVFVDEIGKLITDLMDNEAYVSLFCLMFFVMLSSVTVMNMLIGVLCEVVGKVAAAEKDNAARAQVKTTLLGMLKRLDQDNSGVISKDELLDMLEDPDALDVLSELDVDVKHFVQLMDMLYEEEGTELSIPNFMELILQNRGDRPCLVSDVINGQLFTKWTMDLRMVEQEMKLG